MEKTKNYKLNKPTLDEQYDLDVINQNTDSIDAQMKKNEDGINNVIKGTTPVEKVSDNATNTSGEKIMPYDKTLPYDGYKSKDKISDNTDLDNVLKVGNYLAQGSKGLINTPPMSTSATYFSLAVLKPYVGDGNYIGQWIRTVAQPWGMYRIIRLSDKKVTIPWKEVATTDGTIANATNTEQIVIKKFPSSKDADDFYVGMTQTNYFLYDALKNMPPKKGAYNIWTFNTQETNFKKQLAFSRDTNEIFVRQRHSDKWDEWTELVTIDRTKQIVFDMMNPIENLENGIKGKRYLQLPGEDDPNTMFNRDGIVSTWTEITDEYKDYPFLKLRQGTEGEEESLPNHDHNVRYGNYRRSDGAGGSTVLSESGKSAQKTTGVTETMTSTGELIENTVYKDGAKVTPANTGVRLWKRVK